MFAMGASTHGRRGHEWAARSPDLTVADFALWPYLKKQVYKHPAPQSLEELEARIMLEINHVNMMPDQIRRCHISVKKRAASYLQKNGGHFEK